MAATQIPIDAIPGLFAPQREFLVHNAGDDPIELGYDGETFVIPAWNQAVAPHPKYDDVFHSGYDGAGNLIPGTLLIRDKLGDRNANADCMDTHGRGDRWDAAAAVRHCLGIDPKDRRPSSPWWNRGVSVLPPTPTPDVVEATRKEGRARFETSRLAADRELVNSIMAKAGKERSLGLQPLPFGGEFEKAQARLQAAAQKGITLPPQVPSADEKAGLAAALLEDEDFLATLKDLLAKKTPGKGKKE